MYGQAAIERRRCTGTRKDEAPCRAWAVWDDDRQLCFAHAGRHHRGPRKIGVWIAPKPARYIACRCSAYGWPHRPAGGACRWPEAPLV